MRDGRTSLTALIVLAVAVAFFWTQIHAYLGARQDAAACAALIHPVSPERWHGGNAPSTPDCP